jgi:hypothetical protein
MKGSLVQTILNNITEDIYYRGFSFFQKGKVQKFMTRFFTYT